MKKSLIKLQYLIIAITLSLQLISISNVNCQNVAKEVSLNSDAATYTTTICPVKDNKNAILTITMDDGYPKSSAYYEQQFIANDLRGTSVLICDYLNTLTTKQYFQSLITRGRWEIGSHSKSHINLVSNASVTDAVLQTEIVTSKSILQGLFPVQNVITYTPAENAYARSDGKVLALVKPNYAAMRIGNRSYNSLQPTEDQMYTLNVRGVLTTEGSTSAILNGWVDAVVTGKQWLIEMWHGIKEYDPGTYNPPSETVTTPHFQYVGAKQKAGLLWVATFGEAVQYIRERKAATLVDDGSTTTRTITLADNLDNNLFYYPLTLRSEVPSDWAYVQITQETNVQNVASVLESDSKYYIYYNAVPDKGNILLTKGTVLGSDITSLTASYNGSLLQYVGKTSPVTFTANTVPSTGTNDGRIEWFVNGVRQFTTGRTFTFTPTIEGSYGVIAKTSSSTLPTSTIYSRGLVISVQSVTGLNESYTNSNAIIYSKGSNIYISCSPMEIIEKVNIYDLQGQMIYANNKNGNSSLTINTANKGIYIVKLITNHGYKNQKITVE